MGVLGILGKPDDSRVTYSSEEIKIFAATYQIGGTVTGFGVAGVLVIVLWGWGVYSPGPNQVGLLAFVAADLLVAGAAAAAGALFGFVFGIPRTLEPASRAAVVTAARLDDAAASQAAMGVNTNLERISDWLTTLLIGATLVQIKSIAEWVGGLGKNLLSTGAAANDAIVPIIVIYYFALAFLGVYLITRLYLTSALRLLGMFAAASSAAPDVAAPDIAILKQKLSAAVASGKPGDLNEAINAYDKWRFVGNDAADAEVNANVARILAQQIKGGAGSARAADLKKALARATADPATKTKLKTDLDAGALTTGDAQLDSEITRAVS